MKTAALLKDLQYTAEKVQVSLLMETTTSKEIRICLKEGQEMKAHQAPSPIVVEVFEGEIVFGVADETIVLEKGMLISLEAHVMHHLKAVRDSIVRLSISKSDQLQRVQSIAG